MEQTTELFLAALKAALENRKVGWSQEISDAEWEHVFRLSGEHHVMPLIYNAVKSCPAAASIRQEKAAVYRTQSIQTIVNQTRQTMEFLHLYQFLQKAGVEPCVVKGLVCRSLYPNPDYRLSGDEDLLIDPAQFEQCHQAMLQYGMVLVDEQQDIFAADEVSYRKPGSLLYIELHKRLFQSDSDAVGDMNRFFESAVEHRVHISVSGAQIATLNETDHFFFLICHAFKHFLHSGFGIRQICDIVMFANAYGSRIDWEQLYRNCREIHADIFTAAILQIGRKYLVFEDEKSCCSETWKALQVDEQAMLQDLLEGGVFGSSSMSRQHSSNITLNAVAAQKKGRRFSGNVLRTVFPPVKSMTGRYPYLQKHPYLLPWAWMNRIIKYRKELSRSSGQNDAMESIKIGNQRVELLRQYGVID